MAVGATNQTTVAACIARADRLLSPAVRADNALSKTEATKLRGEIQGSWMTSLTCGLSGNYGHAQNLSRAISCGSEATPAQQVWAKDKLDTLAKRVDALDKKFGIGPSYATRAAVAVGVVGTAIAHHYEYLPSMSSMFSALSLESVKNAPGFVIGSALNATASAYNATATTVGAATSGFTLGSLVPSLGTLGTMGVGAAVALTAMFLASKCLPKAKQA